MRNKIITLFLVFSIGCAFANLCYAQGYGVTTVKVGYFNPKSTKGGLIIGGSIGNAVDEAVDIGLGVDVFSGTNTKETKTGESKSGVGTTEVGWRLDAEASSTIVPITASVTVKIPSTYTLFYTLGGGIGYEMLWTKEKEYTITGQTANSESRFYHGFRWMLTAGLLYKVGSRSSLILEAFYDGTEVSRKSGNITYKVDSSGLGIRTGLRLGIL